MVGGIVLIQRMSARRLACLILLKTTKVTALPTIPGRCGSVSVIKEQPVLAKK